MMEASSPAIAYGPSAGFPVGLGLFGDERLAKLVSSGNERAFTVLFERYHQPLYRYCRSILRHESDAQDALQSAFASALVALRRGQRDAPLRPWLFRIAHNESISLLRRRRVLGQELPGGAEPVVASAEECAQDRERLALLVADLQELPDRQRGALVMRELSGLSHEDIAAALGTSPGTAKQAIFEARAALLEFAEGRTMRCEDICRTISDGDRRALRGRRVRAHLRGCRSCAAFAAAIPSRRTDLHALGLPLAPLAAAGVLGRLTGGGSAMGGASGGSLGGGTASTMVGKLAGVGLTSKALVTVAVVTGAAAGVAGTLNHLHQLYRAPAVSSTSAQTSAGDAESAGAIRSQVAAARLRAHATAPGLASGTTHAGQHAAVGGRTSESAQALRAGGWAHGRGAGAQSKTHGWSEASAHSSTWSAAGSQSGNSAAHRGGASASSHGGGEGHRSTSGSQGHQSAAANSTQATTEQGSTSQGSSHASANSSAGGGAGKAAVSVAKPPQAGLQASLKSIKVLH